MWRGSGKYLRIFRRQLTYDFSGAGVDLPYFVDPKQDKVGLGLLREKLDGRLDSYETY